MVRRCLAMVGLMLAAGGCGEHLVSDIVTVPAPPPDATPLTAFRSTLGESALQLLFIDDYADANGDIGVLFTDGSTMTGTIDFETGEFDVLYEPPAGYFVVSVRNAGAFELSPGGVILGAEYTEEYEYASGTRARWEVEFDLDTSMTLDAVDIDRGTKVHCYTRFLSVSITFAETWDLENGYHEAILTIYEADEISQDWVRDEHSTAVNPDRKASFEFVADGSGTGNLWYFYDHGIAALYSIDQEADGDATETIVFEDPGTTVSPDGEGFYTFEQDNSGQGTYTERYDDGSVLVIEDVYGTDGSLEETFTFDDAATDWPVDTDGFSREVADGSGFGHWQRYGENGVVETCEYEFDTAGSIGQIDCD